MKLLVETVKEFEKRGIHISIDQAHSLHDLNYWAGFGDVSDDVNAMIREDVEIID
jgi:hypothetical protein